MNNPTFEPKLLAFCCENSAILASELASEFGISHPQVEIFRLPCSGKIDVLYLLKGLLNGADGILVMACQKDNCKFLKGNTRAEKRVDQTHCLLSEVGIEPDRVRFVNLAANMGQRFADEVQTMYESIKFLGPNPGKVLR